MFWAEEASPPVKASCGERSLGTGQFLAEAAVPYLFSTGW
jgi:hypothetical protein